MSIGKEMMLLKARIADAKKRREDMVHRADSYIIILRDLIDPYSEDFTTLDIDKAVVIINDFSRLQKEAKHLDEEISRMKRDLRG